jgi:hypothetical protein
MSHSNKQINETLRGDVMSFGSEHNLMHARLKGLKRSFDDNMSSFLKYAFSLTP